MDIHWSMIVHDVAEPIESGAVRCHHAKKSTVDLREFCSMAGWKILMLVPVWEQASFLDVNRACYWWATHQLFAKLMEDGDIRFQNA